MMVNFSRGGFLAVVTAFSATALLATAKDPGEIDVHADVVYGHKMGMALTYDVLQPNEHNGVALLFMVSGGWVSRWFPIEPFVENLQKGNDGPFTVMGDLLQRGYTLILVRHGSAPLFKVPEAVDDVRKAVRHVKSRAASFEIDPERLGVFGASAGGHLSLMLGTTGDGGDAEADDPLDRFGDRVAAVVAYFPPVDLEPYHNDVRFPATHFDEDEIRSVSPVHFVTADDAPALLLHGEKDDLVPPEHSRRIHAVFQEAGVESKLTLFPEAGHAFSGEDNERASRELIHWFDEHLTLSGLLAGEWESVAQTGEGTDPIETRLLFRQKIAPSSGEERAWSGSVKTVDDEEVHFDARIEGASVFLTSERNEEGGERRYTVEARLEGTDRLTGHWGVEGEGVRHSWEATKVE